MPTPAGRRAGATTLAVALLLLAACSSSSSDGAASSSTSEKTAASSTTVVQPEGKAIERYADYESKNYDDPSHWVCRPDQKDICDGGLDAITVDRK